jgi:hypothetical protein
MRRDLLDTGIAQDFINRRNEIRERADAAPVTGALSCQATRGLGPAVPTLSPHLNPARGSRPYGCGRVAAIVDPDPAILRVAPRRGIVPAARPQGAQLVGLDRLPRRGGVDPQ